MFYAPPTKLQGGILVSSCWSVEKWFPYHNSLTFRHTMTILHTQCVAHDLRRTPIDFGVKRFNVKIGYCDSPVLVD